MLAVAALAVVVVIVVSPRSQPGHGLLHALVGAADAQVVDLAGDLGAVVASVQRPRHLHQHARLAEAALRHLVQDPGLLRRVAAVGRQAFDRDDLRIPHARDASHACAGRLAIEVNGARAALANAATEAFEGARDSVRRFLNAPSSDQIIFTRSATEAINLVAQSFGGEQIKEGDEIILSILEHHSNIVPWHFHRERRGAVIKWAPIDDDGNFLIPEFAKLFTSRTKMVAITMMSNALGTVVPVAEVIKIAHAHGVPVLVDASQGAVHGQVDVQALDADFLVFTGHKTYGPSGIGVLYGKSELLRKMPPYQGGGEMISEVSLDAITYNDPPRSEEHTSELQSH